MRIYLRDYGMLTQFDQILIHLYVNIVSEA